MQSQIFLGKYRVATDQNEAPVELPYHSIGSAFKGTEIESGRDVIIEVLPAAALKPVVRQKLEAEAVAAKQLNHINIPALYDFGAEDDQLVYVSEYFDGTSAQTWVSEHGPMTPGAVLRVALQVVGALGAAAFHKIVHHAIHPANIMIVPGQTTEGGWPLIKILHFVGVAPSFGASDEATARFDSSVRFASPEQLAGGTVDFRSEIYSLGCTMWFLLTGAPPLIAPGGPLSVQQTKSGLAVEKLTGVPKRVRRLLATMLAADRNHRPHDPLALYREIQDCLAHIDRREGIARKFGIPAVVRPARVIEKSRPRPLPAKTLALAAILLTIATLAALILPDRLRAMRSGSRVTTTKPIGVPVGVPQPDATVAPVNTPNESKIARNEVTTASQDAALTASNHSPAKAQAEAAIASATAPSAAPAQIIQPTNEPVNEKPALVAADSRSPNSATDVAPPAEGPNRQIDSAPEKPAAIAAINAQPEVRRAEPAPDEETPRESSASSSTNGLDATESSRQSASARPPTKTLKTSRVAKSTGSTRKAVRVRRAEPVLDDDDEEGPPLRANEVRARVVGTTPDGRLLVTLPSSEEVVVVPRAHR